MAGTTPMRASDQNAFTTKPTFADLMAAAPTIAGMSTIAVLTAARQAADDDSHGAELAALHAGKADDLCGREWLREAQMDRFRAAEALREVILVTMPATAADAVSVLSSLHDEVSWIEGGTGNLYGGKKHAKFKIDEHQARRLLIAVENLLAFLPGFMGVTTDASNARLAINRAARRYAAPQREDVA